MPDEPATLSPLDSTKANNQGAQVAQDRTKAAASSALQGHVDYVDLTERVAQGVRVRMPDAEAPATPDIQQSADGAISTEVPQESTPDTIELDAELDAKE
jgi:hypothetical protein